jgi:hypothetical protein
MAHRVTALVLKASLPDTIKNRPVAKLVLLSLASRCDLEGRNARPKIDTICREAEIVSRRAAREHLKALRSHGLIDEQERWRQRRARAWMLNLGNIQKLIPEKAPVPPVGQSPDDPRRSPADPLTPDEPATPDGSQGIPLGSAIDGSAGIPLTPDEPAAPDGSFSAPDGSFSAPDGSRGIPDPVLRSGPLIRRDRTLPQTARFTDRATAPKKTNFFVIRKVAIPIAFELWRSTGEVPEGSDPDLIESTKLECGKLGIDIGNHDAVPFDVVHRACASAVLEVLKAKRGFPSGDPATHGDRE